MLKGILAFGLTRRTIVLMGLLVFVGRRLFAFRNLNIEAYPNPAPVILEITAQAAGLSAEEMERYYTIPMEIGLYPTPGVAEHPLHLVLWPVLCAGHIQIRRRFLFRLHAGRAQPAAECHSAGEPNPADPAIQSGGRDLPLPDRRTSAFRADQSSDHPGLGRHPASVYGSGRRSGELLGAARPRNSMSRPISRSSRPTASPSPS